MTDIKESENAPPSTVKKWVVCRRKEEMTDMMVVAHNLSAMYTQRQLGINTKKQMKSAEKLSSGYKINRSADNAAGLSISEKMRCQIRGLTQGVNNTEEGVSLCQVADGALAEVTDMIHRITELSVQSANGTNADSDRQAIQMEVDQLITEIDRIGNTTKFNEKYLFKGGHSVVINPAGGSKTETIENLTISDFVLADVDLGRTPITESGYPDNLNLQAIVKKADSAFNGRAFNLVYGNGSTSSSSLRLTDNNGNRTEVRLESMDISDFQFDNNSKTWSRKLTTLNPKVVITQRIQIDDAAETEKKYKISYGFDYNKSDVQAIEFMFHVDTAYNNNDMCEGYYVDGKRLENYCVYSKNDSGLITGSSSNYIYTDKIPQDFSIVDVDNALPFSEKIAFPEDGKPDSLSIGFYDEIHEWPYYNASLDTNLGENTNRKDLGFSLYYDITKRDKPVSFDYGIVSLAADKNIENVVITTDKSTPEPLSPLKLEFPELLWIQSGAESGDGLNIILSPMNSRILGMNGLSVLTEEDSLKALDCMENALKQVTGIRSTFGAQQNRLEHIIDNENNIIENTTATESRIRDTDIADEMVRFSRLNILGQVGESILAQANQDQQNVLSLLGQR